MERSEDGEYQCLLFVCPCNLPSSCFHNHDVLIERTYERYRGWDRNFYMEQQRLEKLREDQKIAEAAKALSVSEDNEGREDTEHNSSGFAQQLSRT